MTFQLSAPLAFPFNMKRYLVTAENYEEAESLLKATDVQVQARPQPRDLSYHLHKPSGDQVLLLPLACLMDSFGAMNIWLHPARPIAVHGPPSIVWTLACAGDVDRVLAPPRRTVLVPLVQALHAVLLAKAWDYETIAFLCEEGALVPGLGQNTSGVVQVHLLTEEGGAVEGLALGGDGAGVGDAVEAQQYGSLEVEPRGEHGGVVPANKSGRSGGCRGVGGGGGRH